MRTNFIISMAFRWRSYASPLRLVRTMAVAHGTEAPKARVDAWGQRVADRYSRGPVVAGSRVFRPGRGLLGEWPHGM
jgi:hypothetical protein